MITNQGDNIATVVETTSPETPYEVYKTDKGRLIKAWTKGVAIEPQALQQLKNIADLPFIYKYIVALPDVHFGIGATIGTVLPAKGAVCPASVGVDIGCGMYALQTSLKSDALPKDLHPVRMAIEKVVPMGRGPNKNPSLVGSWPYRKEPERVVNIWRSELQMEFLNLVAKYPKLGKNNNTSEHLGTLGTGNHFIEVCLDKDNNIWFLLHSGSRGIGNQIGQMFIEIAKKHMQTWMITLPDPDLAYLPQGTEDFDWYIRSTQWAQKFAWHSRQVMMHAIIDELNGNLFPKFDVVQEINSHHNYVTWENHYGQNILLTRKGAVRARKDDWGIIPGSMGAKSYIVKGKGNPESFQSCSHGAGRAMGRREAKRRFTVEDHVKATQGIECEKGEGVIDETPACYKPIEAVMNAQRDLVDIVYELHQVVCCKGLEAAK